MARERNPLVVSRVIGDVLDPFTEAVEIRVFSNDNYVFNGRCLRPSQILTRPTVHIGGDGGDFRTFYTLVSINQ